MKRVGTSERWATKRFKAGLDIDAHMIYLLPTVMVARYSGGCYQPLGKGVDINIDFLCFELWLSLRW